ncbi:MAG: GAF domain-containing protein [Candidatus Rokubacteria bacterium]|nr:GAF domain-containing protein [Candidatus Rokubacteria bacterium]
MIGAFGVGDRLGRVFDAEEIRIAQAFADQAAVALENARLHELQLDLLRDTQRQHQEAVALEAVARQLTSSLDREEVLQRIVESARELCRAELGFLAPYDPETDTATVVVVSGARSDVLAGARLARGCGMSGKVIETGEPFVTEDYLHDPRFSKDYADRAAQEGIIAQAVVPLQVKGATTGLLCVANRTHRPFVAEDVAVLAKLADQAAIALENSRLYAERVKAEAKLATRARQQAAVAELGRRALEAVDPDTLMTEAVALVAGALDVEYSMVLELLPGGTALRLRAGVGWRDGCVGHATVGAGRESQAGYTLLSDRPVLVEDLRTETRFSGCALLHDHGVVGGLSVVVPGHQKPFGVLGAHTQRRRTFTGDDVQFLGSVANVLATAIDRKRAEDALQVAHDRLQALSARLVEAQEAERRAIARELHDEIGQALTALKITLEMSTRGTRDAAAARLGQAQALANELMGRVRDLSLDLRPAMLDDLGLLPALLWYLDRYSARTGVRVAFKHAGLERRLGANVETAAYRIVQEALSNVARHARTDEATVQLRADADALTVHVEDGGGGFEAERVTQNGMTSGLAGMRERAALLGGRFRIEAAPGAGTRVTAELPLSTRPEPQGG